MSRRKILLLFAGFLVTLLGATYVVLQETGASKAFVRGTLDRFIPGGYDLREAFIDLASMTIYLEDFQLPGPGGTEEPLMEVESVKVGVSTNPLANTFTVEELTFEGLNLNLDLTEGFPNFYQLLDLPVDTQSASPGGKTLYPPVVITDSKVRLIAAAGIPPIEFTSVDLRVTPENPNSSRMVLTGSMGTSAGFDLEVKGTGDPEKGEFRAVVNATDIPLRPELARLVQPDYEQAMADLSLDGQIDRLSLWVEYPSPAVDDAADPIVRSGVSAEISDLDVLLPEFPYPVRGATAKVSMSTRDGGSFKFDVKRRGAGGDLDVVGAITNHLAGQMLLDLRVRGEDLLVGVDLREAIRRQPVAWTVWQAFQPRAGRADVDLHLASTADQPTPVLEMDLDLQGVSMAFEGFPTRPGKRPLAFPLPLVDARGRVRLRRGFLTLEGIEARVAEEAGGGRMTIDGSLLTARDGRDPQASLDITGTAVQFSPEMRAAVDTLIDNGGAIFDDYGPRGMANVKVRIRPETDSVAPGYQVQIFPLGASAAFRGFPYRVHGIEGSVRIDPDAVAFELTGGDGGASVELSGRFLHRGTAGVGMRSELLVRAADVPADADLRSALASLSPELDRLWQFFSPTGLADCELSLWKRPGADAPSFDLRVDVHDATARLENFPVLLEKLHGSLFVHSTPEGRRTDVFPLRGQIENGRDAEPATFLVQGTVLRTDADESLDLTASVHGLELNRKLAEALDHNGAFPLTAWDILEPSGTVDVMLRQHQAAGADKPDQYLRVWLDDVRSDADMLPQPATHINGEVSILNGEAFFGARAAPRFANRDFGILRGRMGGAEISCLEGHVQRRDGETRVVLTVASEDFPVNEDLANLMKGPLKQAYLDRNMSGAMTVPGLTLTFSFPENAEQFTTGIQGEVRARGVNMKLGTRIEAISGELTVENAVIGPGQGFVDGHLHDVSFRIAGHDCYGFQASYHANADGLQIGLTGGDDGVPDLAVNLHGGTVQGWPGSSTALHYRFRDGGVLSLDAAINGLSLSNFLRAGGLVGNRFRGTVSGRLRLTELVGADFVNMTGSGNLRITDADLGAVPAFTSIYSYIAPERRPRFDGAFIDFSISDHVMWIHRLEVVSPLLDVTGSGTLAFDGYVDMTLRVPNLLGDDADWLVLPQLVHQLTSSVVQFDVFGYMRNTQVLPRFPWDDGPRRQPILPIPPPAKKTIRPPF